MYKQFLPLIGSQLVESLNTLVTITGNVAEVTQNLEEAVKALSRILLPGNMLHQLVHESQLNREVEEENQVKKMKTEPKAQQKPENFDAESEYEDAKDHSDNKDS